MMFGTAMRGASKITAETKGNLQETRANNAES
jgi:hypothetical protein